METGRVVSWNFSEGESFSPGDTLCEIETDKATVGYEAQDEGYLAKIMVEAGDEHPVGVPICVVVEEEEYVDKFANFQVEGAEEETAPSADITESPTPVVAAPVENPLGEFVLFPSARHLSQSRSLDASVLYPGSGKDGRVTKGDVLTALSEGKILPSLAPAPHQISQAHATAADNAAPPPPVAPISPSPLPASIAVDDASSNPYEDVPNSNMRKIIARRLTESKTTVPHFYTSAEIHLDPILALRKDFAKQDIKFSVNDVIVRAAALALRDVPEINASYTADGQIQMSNSIDICIAVATPGGLITPIVPQTDALGLMQINAKIKDLATRARDNKLLPEEFQGGTFTISNLGMFGITEFTAVINPPQVRAIPLKITCLHFFINVHFLF